jgi:hypothetical protein
VCSSDLLSFAVPFPAEAASKNDDEYDSILVPNKKKRERGRVHEDEYTKTIPSRGEIAFTVLFNGHAYALYKINHGVTFQDIVSFCENLGGHLATITSREENDFLYSYVVYFGYKNAYFGLTDRETEGDWEWVNGETSAYRNWAYGEPNQAYPNEDYAMFFSAYPNGTWNDHELVEKGTAFICEWDDIY